MTIPRMNPGDGAGGAARAFFELAAEAARVESRPEEDWAGFLDALWGQLDVGFGLSVADDDLPQTSVSSRCLRQ